MTIPFPYCWNIGFRLGLGSDDESLARTSREIRTMEGEGHDKAESVCEMARGRDGRVRVRVGM